MELEVLRVKLVAVPSVRVLVGVSGVLVKMGTGVAVAVTVTVTVVRNGQEDAETLTLALFVEIRVPVGLCVSIPGMDNVGDGKLSDVLLERDGEYEGGIA